MNSLQMSCPIVLACDEHYAMPLATTLRSLAEANLSGSPLDCHVLCDGFSEDTKAKVFDSLPNGSVSIRWIPVDLVIFQEFSTMEWISKMTYARLLIPDIFPKTVSRVLYLDADTLVLDDLGSLWGEDLEDGVLGAVLDRADLLIKRGGPDYEKVPRVRDYFNAGVLLIDLDRWRKERISEKAMEYLALHPGTPYSDQDALNVVCDGRWKKLDQRWNFHENLDQKFLDMSPEQWPGIIHFVAKAKPWNSSIPNLNAGFYDSFRSRTSFARTSLDKLLDTFQSIWSRFKSVLRQYAFLRNIRDRLKGSRERLMNIKIKKQAF